MLFQTNKTYHLIYPAGDEILASAAVVAADALGAACKAHFCASPDSEHYEAEILLGKVDRAVVRNLSGNLCGKDAYLAGVFGNCFVVLADERLGLAVGIRHLCDCLKAGMTLTPAQTVTGRVRDLEYRADFPDAVRLAKAMFGTYGSWLEKQLPLMSADDQADILLIDELKERLGNGFVIANGCSSALLRGRIVKLDPADYGKTADLSDPAHIILPAAFARSYFGADAPENGGFDLNAYLANNGDYTLSHYPDEGIAVVLTSGGIALDGAENSAKRARLARFFRNPVLPEPRLPIEQTRREIVYSQFGTNRHFDYTEVTYDNYYSPAILVTEREGEKVIYAAHEINRLRNHKETATLTCLKESRDGGDTWLTLAYVADMRWACLVELNGCIYLMGNQSSGGSLMIAEWIPAAQSLRTAVLASVKPMGTAPCAVVIANGRLYRAHNGAVISASVNADLLADASWTVSNCPHELVSRADYERLTGKITDPEKRFWFEEGNVVQAPDGELYAIYRIDATPTWGHAAIFKLTPDGKTLSVIEECGSIIDFPSNQSKFMIKRDPKTGLYLTFTSLPTGGYTHQRNVLGLVYSKDLYHWQVAETVLVDREMMNDRRSMHAHAFQYADFDFDGEDILLIVREACGDTCVYHDGIAVTLYTVNGYAEYLN